MKKLCSVFLVFVLLFTMVPPVFAADVSVSDTASYIEAETGDTITVEAITISSAAISRKRLSSDASVTRTYRNGVLEETLYVDFTKNVLRHEYPDGTVLTEALSDVVTVTEVPPSEDDSSAEALAAFEEENLRSTDYISNEPFTVSSSGQQISLPGAPSYFGYQAMGYRAYASAPSLVGYLQRKNAGIFDTYGTYRFNFSAGTTTSTAASIIFSALLDDGIAVLLATVLALVSAVIGEAVNSFVLEYDVLILEWQYRVRLNGNDGPLIASHSRTKDYMICYNPATGERSCLHRGTAYDGGYLASNSVMIESAILAYTQR